MMVSFVILECHSHVTRECDTPTPVTLECHTHVTLECLCRGSVVKQEIPDTSTLE